MKNLVLIWMLVLTVNAMHGQPGFSIPPCDAVYSSTPDSQDPMTIHFQDHSTGQIALWQWSFGDGVTSTLQNPVHTYAAGGHFFVCLTISTADTGMVCYDVLCMDITVHEPGKCIADFESLPDAENPLLVHFTDKSGGNVNRWHWSFGDGATSDDHHPDHTFAAYGKYPVCLTAYHADSISTCHDIKCDTIEVSPASQCVAAFRAELDSMNTVPLLYRFTSISQGNPTHCQWSFGDGSTASGPEVTHQFPSQGHYNVCLTILKKAGEVVICSDSLCQPLITARYFDLGGHMFIGELPINNPVSTGDTGVAYLFRKVDGRIVPFDTSSFTYLGYYAFPKVLSGSWVIKVALTSGSTHYEKFIPAYFPDVIKWKEAASLHLYDSNDYQSHIRMVAAEAAPWGYGKIEGTVVEGEPMTSVAILPFVEVILYDAQQKPLTFTMSDYRGLFSFSDLAFGVYYLYAEYPGRYAKLVPIWLDAAAPVADSLRLGVFDQDVTGINALQEDLFHAGPLFPNPAGDQSSVVIYSKQPVSLRVEIIDMHGRKIHNFLAGCLKGTTVIEIPVSSIRPGIYLIRFGTTSPGTIIQRKLIKF